MDLRRDIKAAEIDVKRHCLQILTRFNVLQDPLIFLGQISLTLFGTKRIKRIKCLDYSAIRRKTVCSIPPFR